MTLLTSHEHQAAVILTDPKYPHNVGQAIRAASCFGVNDVWMTGDRVALEGNGKRYRLPREERMRGVYPEVVRVDRPFDEAAAAGYRVPVAVELVRGAENLIWFEHPDNAVYVFGPEDGSLGPAVLARCHRVVSLPMMHCANLASAIYVTLYDRHSKAVRAGREVPLGLVGAE